MIALFCQSLPLRKIVGPLLLDVGLSVFSVCAGEFLGDGILDFDRLDRLV